jgi:hypothetical protein
VNDCPGIHDACRGGPHRYEAGLIELAVPGRVLREWLTLISGHLSAIGPLLIRDQMTWRIHKRSRESRTDSTNEPMQPSRVEKKRNTGAECPGVPRRHHK